MRGSSDCGKLLPPEGSSFLCDVYEIIMNKYDICRINGNAFNIMAYVRQAMIEQGFAGYEIRKYLEKAKSSDYDNLVAVSYEYLEDCNERAYQRRYEEDDNDNEGNIWVKRMMTGKW